MKGQNLYLTYKKDTSRLLYWVINTSNGIIRSGASLENGPSVRLNTSGQTTVAEIVNMSRLIAVHLKPIPSAIFQLFEAVIQARSTVYAAFQQMVNGKAGPEIEKSNATHKYFIDALTEAFDALGGKSWDPKKGSANTNEEQDIETFQNYFSTLSINETKAEEEDASSGEESQQPQSQVQQKKKRTGKGKKGKRGKKPKQTSAPNAPKITSLADVPVESYRIIEDKDGLVSDYLLAVYAVVEEWMDLRSFTQDLWREVAYEDLNSAIAASLSSTAISMVKQTCMAVFADFPGHESYQTIIQTITRGNPDKALERFSMSLYHISECGNQSEKIEEKYLDIKEQFWLHTYNDLLAFVEDFRMNRTGKPTKTMQKQLKDWSPTADLQHATNDERIRWRRQYTINWLYDLVNVFSSIVVQRNTMKGESHKYELVDWTPTGPWRQHRRLYGLNEFAGVVTMLAMQKPGTNIQEKILPHHVFELQCVVDSFATSRGWMLDAVLGHVVDRPAHGFRPRRDVDLFLDRENERMGRGILQSIEILNQVLKKDADLHQDPNRHEAHCVISEEIKLDFVNWLGESKYMHGLTSMPESRFTKYNSNGLWEYSPMLCGAGLVEGIVLMQRVVMNLWDRIAEPTLALHLHNMLVKTGYLKQVGLYATLEDMLPESFFPDGIPTSGFHDALASRAGHMRDRATIRKHQAFSRDMTKDAHALLDLDFNSFFKTKSTLMMYYDADWSPDRIPDSAVKIPSLLYLHRLTEIERLVDPITGEERLKETELVKRAKEGGQTDALLLKAASVPMVHIDDNEANMEAFAQSISRADFKASGGRRNPYRVSEAKKKALNQGRSLLEILRPDVFSDICGNFPLSSFNYVWITVHIMMLFRDFEDKFCEARHPLWVAAYENPTPQLRRHKRLALVMSAMAAEDQEAMKLFAECFDEARGSAISCIFWNDIRDRESGMRSKREEAGLEPTNRCSVM